MGEQWEFDRATAVSDLGGGRYGGKIADGWDINGNANGGYLLAIAVRAMRAAAGRVDPCTVTAHFLAPGRPGPVSVVTDVVKSGRMFSTISGSLHADDGRRVLQLLAAFGDTPDSGPVEGPAFSDGGPPELPPIEECVRRTPDSAGVAVALMDRLHVDLDPVCAGFQRGERAAEALIAAGRHPAEMTGYVALADGRPWDTLSLMLAADCFPPAVFNLDLPFGWVPTVELTVQVRGRPAPGPLRARFGTRFVRGSYFEEDGELWDSAGHLVALSRQLALVARG